MKQLKHPTDYANIHKHIVHNVDNLNIIHASIFHKLGFTVR